MIRCFRHVYVSAFGALLVALVLAPAQVRAQDYQQQMDMLNQQMQQSDMQMQQIMRQTQMQAQAQLQELIRNPSPQLVAAHQQYVQRSGHQISFPEFVDNWVKEQAAARMNANPGPSAGFRAQEEMFRRGQERYKASQQRIDGQNEAWRAGQQAIDSGNQAWMNNQQRGDVNHGLYVQGAIQGNQYYRNSETGEVAELPYANSPGVYQNNDNTWNSPSMGVYNQVTPDGAMQRMDPMDWGDVHGDE